MIALRPAETDADRLAVDGAEPVDELHVTLVYLGDAADLDDNQRQAVLDWAEAAAGDRDTPLDAIAWATAHFNPTGDEPCAVYLVAGSDDTETTWLVDTRAAALDVATSAAEIPAQHEPWIPHLTVGYGLDPAELTEAGGAVAVDAIRVCFADEVHDFLLGGQSDEDERSDPPASPTTTSSRRQGGPVRDHRNLPEPVLARLADNDLDLGTVRADRRLQEVRFTPELRIDEANQTAELSGYATVYDYPYDVLGGPPYGWSETIVAGAAAKSIRERDDVRFLVNHNGIPLARTRSATMTLESDDTGVRVHVPALDLRSPVVASFVSAVQRGDMDEMSFAFKALRQEWNADYTERFITELQMFDVAGVTFPANPATVMTVRDGDTGEPAGQPDPTPPPAPAEARDAYPLSLALAEAEQLALTRT